MTQRNEIIHHLKNHASEKYKANVVKLGIPAAAALGVSTVELRKLAKKYAKDKELADELWHSGYHEAKIVAVLLMPASAYRFDELAAYMELITSWDLCDLYCKTVLIQRPDFAAFIEQWLSAQGLYYKRAAYTLIASMSVHAALNEREVARYLALITDSRIPDEPLVKKAASWALRELGKIDETSRDKSIAAAQHFAASSEKARQWIGKDALKELTTLVRVPERSRLISSKSKMGQAAVD